MSFIHRFFVKTLQTLETSAVFAQNIAHNFKSFFDFICRTRIEIEFLKHIRQRFAYVGNLDFARIQSVRNGFDAFVVRRNRIEQRNGILNRRTNALRIVSVKQIFCAFECGYDFFHVANTLARGQKFVLFTVFYVRFFDFVDLEIQNIQFSFSFVAVAETCKLSFQRRILLIIVFDVLFERCNFLFAQLIEKRHVICALQKRLMLVLTVNIDKQFRKTFERRKRGNSTVYSALVFAVNAHFSAEHQHVFALDAQIFEICVNRRCVVIFKNSFNACLVGAEADERFVRALAQNEIERVYDDRLARARFTAQNVQTVFEFERQFVNERNVFD